MLKPFLNTICAALCLIIALSSASISKAEIASSVCFNLDSSNCETGERFVDLRGDAPTHYNTYYT